MKRFLTRVSLVIGALFLLACLGLAVPLEIVLILTLGWVHYFYRVLPHVNVDGSAMATALVCLVLFTAGFHGFASWLFLQIHRSPEPGGAAVVRWPARWTAWAVGSIVLMFVAGLATVGITHQTVWLLLSPEKLVVSGAMGAAMRAQSTNNLKQIGLALYNYQEQRGTFPPACTIDKLGRALHGWQATILPFIEHAQLHDRIDYRVAWDDARNVGPYQTTVQEYLHPGIDPKKDARGYAPSHYAANASMLGGAVPRTLRDVADGTGQTIMAGEVMSNFKPWGDPTNWRAVTLGINRHSDGFGSPSPGGANFLYVDGSVHFLKNTIDPHILEALSTPAGGEKTSPEAY